MCDIHNDALKTVIFVLALVSWKNVVGEIPDDLVADLYELYINNTDNRPASARRVFKQNDFYSVHVNKLKEVNGYKRHNLLVKQENKSGDNPIIYINNPVESKIPNAYLTLEEFRTALIARVNRNNTHTLDSSNNLRSSKKDFVNSKPALGPISLEEENSITNENNKSNYEHVTLDPLQRLKRCLNSKNPDSCNIEQFETLAKKSIKANSKKQSIIRRLTRFKLNYNKNKHVYSSLNLKIRPTLAFKTKRKELKTAKRLDSIPKTVSSTNKYYNRQRKSGKHANNAANHLSRSSNSSTSNDDKSNTLSTYPFIATVTSKSTDSTDKVTSNETVTSPGDATDTEITYVTIDNTTTSAMTTDLTTETSESVTVDSNSENTDALTIDSSTTDVYNDGKTTVTTSTDTTISDTNIKPIDKSSEQSGSVDSSNGDDNDSNALSDANTDDEGSNDGSSNGETDDENNDSEAPNDNDSSAGDNGGSNNDSNEKGSGGSDNGSNAVNSSGSAGGSDAEDNNTGDNSDDGTNVSEAPGTDSDNGSDGENNNDSSNDENESTPGQGNSDDNEKTSAGDVSSNNDDGGNDSGNSGSEENSKADDLALREKVSSSPTTVETSQVTSTTSTRRTNARPNVFFG